MAYGIWPYHINPCPLKSPFGPGGSLLGKKGIHRQSVFSRTTWCLILRDSVIHGGTFTKGWDVFDTFGHLGFTLTSHTTGSSRASIQRLHMLIF